MRLELRTLSQCDLCDLLDLEVVQDTVRARARAIATPIAIIDARDGSVVAEAGSEYPSATPLALPIHAGGEHVATLLSCLAPERDDLRDDMRALAALFSRMASCALDRRAAQERLEVSSRAFENSPVVLFRWKAQPGWPVEYVSRNVRRFGYAAEDLISGAVPFLSTIHPADVERVVAEVRAHVAGGTSQFLQECRVMTRDGRVRFVENRTLVERDATGAPVCYHGIVSDVTDRRLAAEKLKFTQFAVDQTADQAFCMNRDGRILYVNQAACRALGYSRDELLAMTIFDIDPDMIPSEFERAWDSLVAGESLRLESRHRAKDGRMYPIEIRANGVLFGGREYVCAFASDISERKEAASALRMSEERMRFFFERQQVGMAITSCDRFWLEVNDALCRQFGYSREELLSMTWAEVTHPDDLAADVSHFEQLLAGVIDEYTLQKRFVRKDGSVFVSNISIGCVRRADGTVDYVLALVEDITERTRAEQALLRLTMQHEQALRLAHMGHWQFEPDTHTFILTDHHFRLYGTTADEAGGYRIGSEEFTRRFVHPDYVHIGAERFAEALASPERVVDVEFESCMLREDGEPRDVIVWYRIERDEQGKIQLVHGVTQDITERKRAERERARLEEQLQHSRKMETVGSLAGGVAHDFNNLLTPILGYTGMLMRDFPDEDPRQWKLRQVDLAAARARDLTRRLLAFSRKQILELKPLDLCAAVKRFEPVLRGTVREDIQMTVGAGPCSCGVRADCGQIEQVLLNLAVNAQDAMPNGGTLSIQVSCRSIDRTVTLHHAEINPGDYVVLSVADTGIGMDAQTLERIFDPFFTTKELGMGTGLGLATVYGIVKQHGGSITVQSAPGKGSTFEVFLPREVEVKDVPEPCGDSRRPAARGRETILVVEDNDMVRQLAGHLLRGLGYQVLLAACADDCLEKAAAHTDGIDLLLTDVIMPKMNGKELYAELRKVRPGLKVLYMSGYASDVIGHHGVLDEHVHFIQKPFSLTSIAAKLRVALES